MLEERQPIRVHQPGFSGLCSLEVHPSPLRRTSLDHPVADGSGITAELLGNFVDCKVTVVGHGGILLSRGNYAPVRRIKEIGVEFGEFLRVTASAVDTHC
jgi:hypothetical protein